MAERLTPDICVIGAGSGGLSVAAAAAAFGVPVVLVENGKMGGDCLNYGCVPSKALIAAAKHGGGDGQRRPRSACTVSAPRSNFFDVRNHVHGVIAAIAPNDSTRALHRSRRAGDRGRRPASQDTDTVTVDDDVEIKARRFVIATGSSPAIPPIPVWPRRRISPTRRSSISPPAPSISSSSAPARSGSSSPRRSAGSAPTSPCSRPHAARQGRSRMRGRGARRARARRRRDPHRRRGRRRSAAARARCRSPSAERRAGGDDRGAAIFWSRPGARPNVDGSRPRRRRHRP